MVLGSIPYRFRTCETFCFVVFTDSAISCGLAGVVVVRVRIASALLPGMGLRTTSPGLILRFGRVLVIACAGIFLPGWVCF